MRGLSSKRLNQNAKETDKTEGPPCAGLAGKEDA